MRSQWLLALLIPLGLTFGSGASAQQLFFSGGEDIDFVCNPGGNCSTGTSGADYRANWAREAVQVPGDSASDPPADRFATPTFAANSTLWIHAQYFNSNNLNTTSNAQMLRIFDSSGNPTLIVRGTGSTAQLKVSSRTAAGVFTDLLTCSSAFNLALTQLDLFVNYSASGEVALYNNSVQVCDFTGNVTNGDGATTLNQAEFATPYAFANGNWSEVIIAGTDTRAMSRFTANTVGNGNTTGFSGTNICSSIWSAISYNDSNYGYSGTSSVLHECTINSAIPAGTYTVLGLVMSARALVGASGPQHFAFLTRTGATDYTSSSLAPTTSFSNLTNYIQTVNPATSNPWAVTDFQAAGFNVGEETQP